MTDLGDYMDDALDVVLSRLDKLPLGEYAERLLLAALQWFRGKLTRRRQ